MKTIGCFEVAKMKEILPHGYEFKQVIHIFQGDTMGNSTFEYYFAKPEVDKLFTDMDYGSDKVDLIMTDGTKIDLSFHAMRKSFGEFRINELISPPLKVRDGYIESTSAFEGWLMRICNINYEILNKYTVVMEISETILYDRLIDMFVYDSVCRGTVELTDDEAQAIIDDVSNPDLKEKITAILLSRRWNRTETGCKIKNK